VHSRCLWLFAFDKLLLSGNVRLREKVRKVQHWFTVDQFYQLLKLDWYVRRVNYTINSILNLWFPLGIYDKLPFNHTDFLKTFCSTTVLCDSVIVCANNTLYLLDFKFINKRHRITLNSLPTRFMTSFWNHVHIFAIALCCFCSRCTFGLLEFSSGDKIVFFVYSKVLR